jgi:hypothetical protein
MATTDNNPPTPTTTDLPGGPHPPGLDEVRRCAEEVFDTAEGVRVARENLTRAEADAAAAMRVFQAALKEILLVDLARALSEGKQR